MKNMVTFSQFSILPSDKNSMRFFVFKKDVMDNLYLYETDLLEREDSPKAFLMAEELLKLKKENEDLKLTMKLERNLK